MPIDFTSIALHWRCPVAMLALVLSLPPQPAVAASGTTPERSAWVATVGPDGKRERLPLQEGQIAYQIGGAGERQTILVDASGANVIVELRGAPLAVRRGPADRAGRRSAAAYSAIASAAEAIEAQHDRVRQAISSLASQGARARGAADPTVAIRYEYRDAFNGLALTAPAWLIEQLRANPEVVDIRPDVTMRATLGQSVPLIGASDLHRQGVTGEGVVVGILDTGIDYTHPDLGGGFGPGFKVIGGYDFVNGDDDPRDDHGHGTHVAGTVAANGTLKGVAPGATLVAYKVLNQFGSGALSGIIAAIDRSTNPDGDPMTDDALDVINLSFGGPGDPDDPGARAIDNAAAAGVVCVVAAGNSGGFQSVSSPGVARRALTVGASDKSDRIAPFSSRGPSERIYGVKPEVVAPGVAVLSTFPNNTSRPSSGTSMATPHVAGAAALLLQARPGLSPEAIKSVLMTTARDLGENLFAQGAGRIDLPAAARRTTLVTPAALSFGVDDIAVPVFSASETITVTNTGTAMRRYATSVAAGLPAGIGVTVSPAALELAPGASGTLIVGLTVDNTTVPNVDNALPSYAGRVRLAADDETLHVPFAFLKSAQLRFTFDHPPSLVLVRSAAGRTWALRPTGARHTLLVPSGTYAAYAMFLDDSSRLNIRHATVAREAIVLETLASVEMRSTDAVHVVNLAPRDEDGATVATDLTEKRLWLPGATVAIRVSFFIEPGARVEYAYSPLSPGHRLDWMATAHPAPETAYSFFWHRRGLAASETLTNGPADLTTLDFAIDADPGTSVFDLIHWSSGVGTSVSSLGMHVPLAPPFRWKRILMGKPAGDSFFGYVDNEAFTPDARLAHSTPWYEVTGGVTSVRTVEFPPPPAKATLPLLFQTRRRRFDIGLEPYYWSAGFANQPDAVRVAAQLVLPFSVAFFVGQEMDNRGGDIPYELRRGTTVVRKGELLADGPLFPVAPGRYTFEVRGPAGSLDGRPTASVARATFDTAAADPNPPVLSHVQILANGRPSKAFCIGERAEIRFRVKDDVGVTRTRLQFRLGTQGPWLSWPLQRDGEDLVVRLPLGFGHFPGLCSSGPTQAVPISVRIEAADAQGNVLETLLTPAYARLLPRVHAAPLVLQTP